MKLDEIDDADLIRSLSSLRCPACGGPKERAHTLCGRDYFRLPGQARRDLYRRVGEGYREAVLAAFGLLKKTEFLMPPEAAKA